MNNSKQVKKRDTGTIRGRKYIDPGPGEPRRSLWIFEGPHSLSH